MRLHSPRPPADPDAEPGRQPPLPPDAPYPAEPQEDPPPHLPDQPPEPPPEIIATAFAFSRSTGASSSPPCDHRA